MGSFSILGAISYGWELVKGSILSSMLYFFVMGCVLLAPGFLGTISENAHNDFGMGVAYILIMVAYFWIWAGTIKFGLTFTNDEVPELADFFMLYRLLPKFALVTFLYFIMVYFGSLLIIVGLILGLKFFFAPFIILDDEDCGVFEAFTRSGYMTDGNKVQLYIMMFALNLFNILGIIPGMGIGLLITFPISAVAVAYVYRQLGGAPTNSVNSKLTGLAAQYAPGTVRNQALNQQLPSVYDGPVKNQASYLTREPKPLPPGQFTSPDAPAPMPSNTAYQARPNPNAGYIPQNPNAGYLSQNPDARFDNQNHEMGFQTPTSRKPLEPKFVDVREDLAKAKADNRYASADFSQPDFGSTNSQNSNYGDKLNLSALDNQIDMVFDSPNETAAKYFESANSKYKSGDFEGAVADYSVAIQNRPQELKYYYARGSARIKTRELMEAIDDFTIVISNDNKNAKAYFYRGACKSKVGDKNGAKRDIAVAIQLKPELAKLLKK